MGTNSFIPDPSLPWDEDSRLRALRNLLILDTPCEEAFDRITKLAASSARAPISMLSFADERRFWAKSSHGTRLAELPLKDSFSIHAISDEGCFVVLNALEDPRFTRNPLVIKAGGLRFYAGAALRISGCPVGVLCVADSTPRRRFSLDARKQLMALAAMASDELELRLLRAQANPKSKLSEASEHCYSLASLATQDGFWDWDTKSDVFYFSPRWQEILGLGDAEYIDRLGHWVELIHPQDRARVSTELTKYLGGNSPVFRSEHRMRHADGSWRWMLARGNSLEKRDGVTTRMAGSLCDVTEGKMADPLTNLPNRFFLIDQLEGRMERASQTGIWNFSVFFIELDCCNLASDPLGRENMEAGLLEVANRLYSIASELAQGMPFSVARVGNAKFALLLDEIDTETKARLAATAIASAICPPFDHGIRTVLPFSHIGIVLGDGRYLHPEEILRAAENAASLVKEEGMGGCVVFTENMHQKSMGRLQLYSNLRRAIREHELILHYQPEVDLQSSRVIGFEALVRWQHPERGLVAPGDFIPLAEETGLILPLGDWGLAEACRQMVEWRDLSPVPLDLRMSVNLSAKEFSRPGLVERVARALAESGMLATQLRLEVTESSLMDDTEDALSTMHGLRDMGVGLHLDDFGTGYSSLNYLHRFPFDTLKIDRSFIQRVCEHKESLQIVRTILELAESLSMQVVAEGIETLSQLNCMKTLGCQYGQGFYFSRALPAESILAMLPSLGSTCANTLSGRGLNRESMIY